MESLKHLSVITPKIVCAVAVLMVFTRLTQAQVEDSDHERCRPKAEKLKWLQTAEDPWLHVNRWLIEYEAIPYGVAGQGISAHKMMAVSAPGEFYQMTAHFPNPPWQLDPFAQEFFIHNGKICHQWPFNRTYSEKAINPGDFVPGTASLDVLLDIIPRWPLVAYKIAANLEVGAPVILVDLVDTTDCTMLKKTEFVGGENCVVFDYMGVQRIWVTANKGLCLMRRDTLDPYSRDLVERILTDKVKEVEPGLWLPMEYRVQYFRPSKDKKENILDRESKISILHWMLDNDVPESTFVPVHPSGSLKYQSETEFAQTSPGGEDLLNDIVSFMVKYRRLPTKPIPHAHPYMWLFAGMASGLLGSLFFFPIGKLLPAKMKEKVFQHKSSKQLMPEA